MKANTIIAKLILAILSILSLLVSEILSDSVLSREELTACIYWNDFDFDCCYPGYHKCRSSRRSGCCPCQPGSFMEFYNKCSQCLPFRDCPGRKILFGGNYMHNRICGDLHSTTGGPVETTLTLHDVKDLLSEELTVQDCYEIAIFLGLQARYVQEISQSQNSAFDLIDKISDGKDNSDSTISALLFALQKRGMIRVANLILNSEGLPSSIKARASSKETILLACVCGKNSFKELKSHSDESSVVSLQCNSCAAEWFPITQSSTEASLVLLWEGNKYRYKIPYQLDLSELKHEKVKDVNNLQHGDHIVFRRAIIYDHHAIFLHISENEKGKIKVIHWTGPPVRIKCEDISFPTGGVRRVQYPKSDPADVVVARAYDMLYNSRQVYDLANNNCESLATYCKIGKAFSIQGEVVGDLLPLLSKVLKYFKS